MTSEKPATNHLTESIAEAKSIIDTLQFVFNNMSLRSEDRNKFQPAVARLKTRFGSYFRKNDTLFVVVKNNRLIDADE